jgi:PAS domain S-box-containing protein
MPDTGKDLASSSIAAPAGAVIARLPHIMSGDAIHHLEQLIEGLSGGVILADPTGTILWANKAALVMHGVTSLASLGSNSDEYCSRFVMRDERHRRLETRRYPIMRALAGEDFEGLLVEVSAVGVDDPRWVHQIRTVVLSDPDGEPDCIALVMDDVSARFEAEERFEAMFQANPAPALIARLADQRFVRVNLGFLELAGYSREAVMGKSLFELDILQGAERRELAKERLAAGKTIPQMEAELPLPKGHTKLVIVAGQPIEMADEPCMLFTFADLEPRRKAETALRAGEKHFATVFQMAPVAMVLTSPEQHLIIEANEAFTRMTGYPASLSIGRAPDELELWDNAAQRRDLEQVIAGKGGVRNCDVRVLHKDGDTIDCLLSAERVNIRNEHYILWLYQDITARRHSELELIEAIETVMKDTSWFSRSVIEQLANLRSPPVGRASPPQVAELTAREREVLELICGGLEDKAIAQRLSVSNNTVRNHVARIYAKIGVKRRSAAVVWARERGVAGALKL